MTADSNNNSRLQELGNDPVAIVDLTADIRGRKVEGGDGEAIGLIKELLYDIQSRKVRYATVQLDIQKQRTVLVPIAQLAIHADAVTISRLTLEVIEHLPDYTPDEINPGVENMVRLAFSPTDFSHETIGLTGHPDLIITENQDANALFQTTLLTATPSDHSGKTVKAMFDDGLEAETSFSELLAAGFNSADIEISSGSNKVLAGEPIETPAVANGGTVLSIKIAHPFDSEKASEILNKNGAVSVFEQ